MSIGKNNTVGRYPVRSALLSFCKVFSLSSVCLLLLGISPVTAQDGATECEAENTSDFRSALANSACDVINLTGSDYLITSSALDYALTINRPVVIQGNGASQTKIRLAWGILVDAPNYPPSPDSIDPEELLCDIGEICTTDFPWMRVEIRDVSIVSALIGPTSVTNDGALLTLERVNISNSIGVTAGALLNIRGNVWLKDSLLKGNSSGIGGAITNAPLAIPDTLGVTDLFNLAVISGAYSADLEDGTLDSSFDLFPGGSLPFMLITNTDIVDNQAESLGGGISNSFGTVLVVNSRISNNKVETLTGALGGGLSNVAGVAIVADSIFQNNIADAGIEFDFSILGGPFSDLPPVEVGAPTFTYASAGGAIYSQTGVLAVQRTDFLGNKASSATFGSRGGAIYAGSALPSPLNDASVSYIDKVTMSDNESGGGGAVHFSKGSHTIKRTFFSDNIVSGIGSAKGGAILVENAMLDLQQATLQRNKAKGNGEGGGIAFVVSTAEGETRELNVSNSTFSENSAENSGPVFGNGGALYIFSEVNTNDEGVARPTQDIPKVVLEHTTFYANTADRLGSHYFAGSTTALQTIDITVKGSVFTGGNLPDEDDDCYLMPGGPLNPDAIDKTEEFSYAATATCGGGGGQYTDGYLLQPLALNGAAVPTHMPSESSSLVDKIQCYSDIDQRGLSRPYQAKSFLDPIDICDPGAVEYADYKLTAFTPAPHANNVAANATIVVTFRDPLSNPVALSTDSVSDESLVVDSNLRGRIAGSFSFSDNDRRVSFSPTQPLLAGEQVRVVVTSKIESEKGVPLSNPTQWSFSVGNGAPPHCIAGFSSAGVAFPAVRNATSKLADLDNDGDLDFVLTGSTGTYSRISRVYSNNEGSFDIVGEFDGMQSAALAWGDVNGDGLTDLAATGRTGPKLFQFSTETLFASGILSLQPDGFNTAIAPLPLFDAAAVALGDINTDGLLDLLIAGLGESEAAAKRILNRSGRLSATFDLLETAKGLFGGQIILGDLDSDGDLDAVMSGFTTVGSTQVGEIWVLSNNGGEFTQTEKFNVVEPNSFAVADVDGDNDLDLLIGPALYLNRGTGVFNFSTFIDLDGNDFFVLRNYPALHFVDLNGDEAPDLVVSDRFFLDSVPFSSPLERPKIRVLINHDGGKFDANSAEFSRTLPIPYVGDGRIEWGDIDGDGDQDALVAGVEQTQIYYQQQCAAVDDLYEVLSVYPQSVGSPELVSAAGGVLRNDKTLFARSAVLEDDVSFGDLEFRADGSFVYTPLPYFNGTDQFSYRVQSSGVLTEPAVISIDVLADRSFACYATSDNGTFVYASNDAAALTLVLSNTQPGGTVKVAGDCVGVTPRGEFAETLFIDKDVTILGGFDPDDWIVSMPELFPTLLSADNSGRVVVVTADSQVVLRDLNLSNGVADNGAGILNEGTLSLATTSVTGNSATENGGGIYNQGDLTLTASLVALNTAPNGGGIYSNAGSLSVRYSTLSTNQADNGGALWISQPASATFNSTTVAFNEASTEGGGLWLETLETVVNLQNTLLSDNVGSDCGGFFPESNGYNLNADGSCGLSGAGDSSVDPLLRSLLANGGATLTHALPVNSPAIDAGNPAGPGTDQAACSALDQRGVPRVETDSCDIGAYEAAVQEQCFAFNATTSAEYITGGRFLIQTAIDEAAAGDTIRLSGYCTGSATINKNLHIQGGYDSSNWNIYSPDAFPTTFDALGRRGFLINGVAEVTIEGLTITNSVGAIVSQSSNRNLTVRTCKILDNISPAIEFNGIAFRMEDTEVRRNTYIGDPDQAFFNGVIDLKPRSRTSGMVVSIVNSVIGESIGTYAVRLQAGSVLVDPSYAIGAAKTTLELIDSSIIDNLGGGVQVSDVMSLSFDNTIVRGNRGPQFRGAAVEIQARLLPFKLNISGGEFSDNSSSGVGAIEIDGWGDVSIVDAHFENNQNIARYTEGGALSWHVGIGGFLGPAGTLEPSSLVVRNSRFQGNFGGNSGGALLLLNGPSQPLLDVNIYNSWFEDNGARPTYSPPRAHGGGAIALVPDSRDFFERAPINATISGSTFINNTAFIGGAIRADRINELIISESTFLNNNAAGQSAGALAAMRVERLAISTSSFIGNTALGNGGAIRAAADNSTLNAVSILNNAAGAAGGGLIVEGGHTDIINSTISGNTACVETLTDCTGSYQARPYGTGGGIAFSGGSTSDIKMSSIVNNQASQFGSGLFTQAGASVGFSNTVISNNSAGITGGGNCDEAGPSTLTSNGFNLEDKNECGFDQASDLTNMAALLEPLADNGGLTLTHAPMANSPVINAGDCLADTVKVDQTGKARPVDGACDIGAYEGLGLTDRSTIIRLSIAPTPSVVGEAVDLRVAVDNTEATPDGLVVFFNGSIELGSAPLDENGEAVLSVDHLAFGPHLLRADYQGTVRINAGSGQINHTVNAAVTELEIYASTPSISQTDDNVTFLFQLSVTAPGAGTPDGIISLSENAVELCRVTLPASSCSAVLSTSGFHILEAKYLGSEGFAGATSALWVQRVIERGPPTPPQVQKIGSSADTGDNALVRGEQTNAPISKLRVTFSQAMSDPAGDQQRGDVSNTGSYLLVKAVDAATGYQSFSCEEGATLTDTAISIDSVNWISGSATAELSINGGTPLASGNYLLLVCDALNSSLSSNLDGNRDGLPGGNYLHPFEVDLTPPRIVSVVTIPALDDGASLGVGLLDFVPQAFVVEFDELTQDPAGDTLTSDASNPANYLLFGTGPDSSFETQDCATGVATTDRQITLASTVVSTQSATVILPPAAQFSPGEYRFMVCGTTTIYDIAGNALDGNNNGQGGDDFVVNFAVTLAATTVPVPTMGRWALVVLTLMTLLLVGAYLRKFARVEAA
jgi:predicted outer membrane repeat protein